MSQPLVDQDYLLQKMPGKGGWTFIILAEIPPGKRASFNQVKVNGRIDDYPLVNQSLMPVKGGKLFLPVKAEIRKKIGKEAGDTVRLVLFATEAAPSGDAKSEFMLCLEEEPEALKRFAALGEEAKRTIHDWISSARNEDQRVERMAESINRLMR